MTAHFFLLIYKGSVGIHVITSCLACFLFFPINIFNAKGSAFHKKIGRLTVISVDVICASGFLMLINPVFPNQFAQVAVKHQWTTFFNASLYEPIIFYG